MLQDGNDAESIEGAIAAGLGIPAPSPAPAPDVESEIDDAIAAGLMEAFGSPSPPSGVSPSGYMLPTYGTSSVGQKFEDSPR